MKKPLTCGLLLAGLLCVVSAQTPTSPTFEVASVKQNKSGERSNSIRRLPGGRVTVSNMPVRTLLIYAYQIAAFQLVGGPGWLDDDRFDMVAKLEGNPEFGIPGEEPDPIRLAMRTLLTDRFKLKVNRETREMDIYALVMIKPGVPGPALKPVSPECAAAIKAGPRAVGPPPGPAPAIPWGRAPARS